LGQHRSTQRKKPAGRADEDALTRTIINLASQYGRYGYRRIHWLLEQDGWQVSLKRVKRIWRREGLKVPRKQPKRRRLWLNDGSCIRLRPTSKNHVWSYETVQEIIALAEKMTVEEADQWSQHLKMLQSDIKADESGFPIQEIDNPQIDAEDHKIERLNQQKKNIQIKKKQLKIRDQQKALAKLRKKAVGI
jgi:hypothetical protein